MLREHDGPDETGDAGPATLARRRTPDTLAAPGQRLRRRRMSAKRKQSAILRLLRGEDLDLVSAGVSWTLVGRTACPSTSAATVAISPPWLFGFS